VINASPILGFTILLNANC